MGGGGCGKVGLEKRQVTVGCTKGKKGWVKNYVRVGKVGLTIN